MKAKMFLGLIAITTIVVLALGVSQANAAPAASPQTEAELGPNCSVNQQGEVVCYEYTEPDVTEATWGDCPEGYEPTPGSESECRKWKDESDWSYVERPQIPATYKCPWGYDLFENTCRKLDHAAHWDYKDRPYTMTCPGSTTWKYTWQGHTYTITFSYDKSSDPNKCHRPSDSNTPPHSWPGYVRGKFNSENPEWIDATKVWSNCSDLGAGWEQKPGHEDMCRLWVPDTYKYKDPIVDDPAHPGKCPEGYEVFSDTQCRIWVENGHYDTANRELIEGTVTCPEGYDLNGETCQKVVDCPPVVVPTASDPGFSACEMVRRYNAKFDREGWPDPTIPAGSAANAFPLEYIKYQKQCNEARGIPAGAGFNWMPVLIAVGVVAAIAFMLLALRRRTG